MENANVSSPRRKRTPLPESNSFDSSFDDDDDEEHGGGISMQTLSNVSTSLPNSALEVENERLKDELKKYKKQLAMLQDRLNRKNGYKSTGKRSTTHGAPSKNSSSSNSSNNNNNNKNGKPSLLLELPANLRSGVCCKSGRSPGRTPNGQKDHQSLSTDDEQETIEPNMEMDLHQSAGGLYHRATKNNHNNNNNISSSNDKHSSSSARNSLKISSSSSSPKTKRTDPTTDGEEDNSISSTTSDGDSCNLEEGLLVRHHNHNGAGASIDEEDGIIVTTGADHDNRMESQTFYQLVSDRAGWLVGLLVLQSMSSFILARNEALLQEHLVIVRFLTMLVGAGGNAGNQASVRVIRGLAVGEIDQHNQRRFLRREFMMGVCLSLVLGTAGCIRAAVFMTPWLETLAITTSLFMIVIISIVLGAMLPLAMSKIGIDPAHSSTTIQVIMDILGVTITVHVSSLVLDSNFQEWLTKLFQFS